jgi:hypothetical protein
MRLSQYDLKSNIFANATNSNFLLDFLAPRRVVPLTSRRGTPADLPHMRRPFSHSYDMPLSIV